MIRLATTFVIGSVLALAAHQSPASAQGRTIKNAVLQVTTGDDGKDDTDVFTVTVTKAGSKVLERVFDAKEEIKPETTFNLWLTKVQGPAPDTLLGAKVAFHIETKWDEHWVIKDARLTVNYDSGAPDRWHWGPFVLERKGPGPFQVEYAITDDRKVPAK